MGRINGSGMHVIVFIGSLPAEAIRAGRHATTLNRDIARDITLGPRYRFGSSSRKPYPLLFFRMSESRWLPMMLDSPSLSRLIRRRNHVGTDEITGTHSRGL